MMSAQSATRIRGLSVRDIRFPTSMDLLGSDSIHPDPDYSCAYVIIYTDTMLKGHGLSFTIGRGNDLVVMAVKSLAHVVVGREIRALFSDFGSFWRELTSESQLRWVGPEKGVIHLAVAAITNALFDLWARIETKPLWKLLVDLEPEVLVSTIDFRYIGDVLTKEEAIALLRERREGAAKREVEMLQNGYPAYTTACGWLGYSDEKITRLVQDFLTQGWRHFKVKVGQDLEDDIRRCRLIRKLIGNDNVLMVDANQKWDVDQAVEWMRHLAPFRPLWIEEPTSPDDVLGHATVAKALRPLGIGVATGEMAQNRVIFKQLLQADAIDFCQIDACRMGGVPEVLAVYLMAAKFGVPVCPHAGGVGLCEMVQHLQLWDYICLSGSTDKRLIEYVGSLGHHFRFGVNIKNCSYMPPKFPGYSTEMKRETLKDHEYPYGAVWRDLFAQGLFRDPKAAPPSWIEHKEDEPVTHR
ncbi:mitochondrial enolase superfamily member 1-like [Oratosquilla oratoria]|uniref:mitochondrial enolase superfamily member 1-like n=1 Tax=Oratosquilla oratoria TaxID=337810 RepID=UPI003F76E676